MPRLLKLLPTATVFVDKREAADYRQVVPASQLWLHDGLVGLVSILNQLNGQVQEDAWVKIDDDFLGVVPLLGRHRRIEDPAAILTIIENGHRVAEGWGIGVWCWGRTLNRLIARPEVEPIRLAAAAAASYGLRGAARSRKFDLACEFREDLDFTMRTLLEDRIVLHDVRYYFDHGPTNQGQGGNQGLATKEQFDRATATLIERWGDYLGRRGLPWLKRPPTIPPMSVRVQRRVRLREN